MTQVSFRVDENIKRKAEIACADMGMNMSTAINIFLVKLGNERRIPFDVTADPDPFYSESNMRYLERKADDYKSGRLTFEEHELIEE